MDLHIVIAGDYETRRNIGAFTNLDEAQDFRDLVRHPDTLESDPDLFAPDAEIETWVANDPFTTRTVFTATYMPDTAKEEHRDFYRQLDTHSIRVRRETTVLMPKQPYFNISPDGKHVVASVQALSEADAALALGKLLAEKGVQA
jgi:hypothetical protein